MDEEIYKKAKERVNQIRGFYSHLAVYIIINLIFYFYVGKSWLWVTAFWGIGVVMQFINTIILGKDWEEKKIQEFIEKEKRSKEKREENQ